MGNNPFKPGTKSYTDFETMSDLQWHCTKCELQSGQAKTWQVWRQMGIQLDRPEGKRDYCIYKYCDHCKETTAWRRLITTEINQENIVTRANISPKLAKRIKKLYDCIDEYTGARYLPEQLEIDHRIPQVRWSNPEDTNDSNMSDEEIRDKFMLLTRQFNEIKSRACERCKETGLRGTGYNEIAFWYEGDRHYNPEIGCNGCFWHNPSEWRKKINEFALEAETEEWEKEK